LDEEWKYMAVYALIIIALLIQVTLALLARTIGLLAPVGILAISGLEATFVFLVFMQGRYGPRSITAFMALSLATLIPLFIALVFSVAFPQHALSSP
jgi:uncharacterized PurR-regulated membrane protein YhhQ (DUF165 family)